MKMNKPEGATYLFPKYFTELHKEVLEILGEQKCLELNNLLDPHDSFSFKPIATYIKRCEIKKLLEEGLDTTAIAEKLKLPYSSVWVIQLSFSKKSQKKKVF